MTDETNMDSGLVTVLLHKLRLEVARFPVGIAHDGIKAQDLEL